MTQHDGKGLSVIRMRRWGHARLSPINQKIRPSLHHLSARLEIESVIVTCTDCIALGVREL
jgi:hypothetical protein